MVIIKSQLYSFLRTDLILFQQLMFNLDFRSGHIWNVVLAISLPLDLGPMQYTVIRFEGVG